MYPNVKDSPQFEALLAGDADADLTVIALEIAHDAYASLNMERYLDRVAALARRIKGRLGTDPEPWLIVEAINAVLFKDEGFSGNDSDYYDPRNSYLNEVLDRKTGIPISLSVLYRAIAERLGLALAGVNLPAHFVLCTVGADESFFIDPFNGGVMLDREGCERLVSCVMRRPVSLAEDQFRPCSTAAVAARLLQNLKTVYLRQRKIEAVIPVLKRLVLLRRDTPEELRDLGIACFYGERRHESYGYLSEYLRLAPAAFDAREIRLLLNSAGIH